MSKHDPSPRLYISAFLLLCLSQGPFAASFNMMIPELPVEHHHALFCRQIFRRTGACAGNQDIGHPQRKGRAMATMYISLEIAIGGGAALAGWYFADDPQRMPAVFYFAAFMSFAGWVYLSLLKRGQRRHREFFLKKI